MLFSCSSDDDYSCDGAQIQASAMASAIMDRELDGQIPLFLYQPLCEEASNHFANFVCPVVNRLCRRDFVMVCLLTNKSVC